MAWSAFEPLRGHTDEETAYVVDDYPYGYRLRTEIRYWIETTKRGDRFVSQTLNPKTGRWNKPKRSTYTGVAALIVNGDGHVKWTGINFNCGTTEKGSGPAAVESFLEWFGKDHLSDLQRKKIAEILGYERTMEKVTWSVKPAATDPEERELERIRQKRSEAELGQVLSVRTRLAERDLGS